MLDKKAVLHLSLINGIGIRTILKLCNDLTSDLLYNFKISNFMQYGFSELISKKIYDGLSNKELLNDELNLLQKNNIEYITCICSSYPSILLENSNFPPILYIEGNTNLFKNTLCCMVSSRKTTSYGAKVIDSLISKMSTISELKNTVILSGGAIGGDKIIHEAALNHGLKTIAIIGSGLLEKYPSSNQELFKKIVEHGGAIISPFSLKTKASLYTFPNRNYILASLSKATIIIEAAPKSGTLITANAALEANKNIGIVPGNIFSEFSLGGLSLLKQGAMPVSSIEDIAELLEIQLQHQDTQKNSMLENINDPLAKINTICKEFTYVIDIKKNVELSEQHIEKYLFELLLKNKAQQDFLGRWKIN